MTEFEAWEDHILAKRCHGTRCSPDREGGQWVAVLAPSLSMRFPWYGEYLSGCRVGLVLLVGIETPATPLAPPTHDTTFNPRTPPMASYYYYCTGAEPLPRVLSTPLGRGTEEERGCSCCGAESRRSHSIHTSFCRIARGCSKTVARVNIRRCLGLSR